MISERNYSHYLEDIQDAIGKVTGFIEGMSREEFEQDEKTAFAVIRALEIIGEAAKSIPDSIKAKYPQVPWREMAGMRDKLTHQYFGVSVQVVWRTATEELPDLGPVISGILKETA
jgi:uncharacterized protein with HEPN domain